MAAAFADGPQTRTARDERPAERARLAGRSAPRRVPAWAQAITRSARAGARRGPGEADASTVRRRVTDGERNGRSESDHEPTQRPVDAEPEAEAARSRVDAPAERARSPSEASVEREADA